MISAKELHRLPKNWEWTTLGVVTDISSGFGFPKNYQGKPDGQIPFFKVMDISRTVLKGSIHLRRANNYISFDDCKEIKARPLKEGTIVFAKIGEAIKLNRRAILAQDSLVDNNIMGLKISCGKIDNLFLFNFLNTIKLGDCSRATTVPSLRKSDVELIPFPIAPFNEQHRIVAKIEELFSHLDAGVDALQKGKAQLRRYRQSVLKAAVEGRLTEKWRKEHPEVEPAEILLERILNERRKKWEEKLFSEGKDPLRYDYKEPIPHTPSDLPPLPKGWIWTSYDAMTSFVTSGSRAWKKFLGKGDAVFILLQNLRERQLILDNPTFIDAPDGAEADRTRVLNGDILISIVGNTGVTCLVREISEAYVSQSVALTRPINLIDGEYLEFYFSSEIGQDFFKKKDYGMGRGHLLLSHIKETPIVLPPITEQYEIIREIKLRFSLTCDLEEAIFQSETPAKLLRQSILKSAFEGRLVPQDPNDEPASLLLERIKAGQPRIGSSKYKRSRLRTLNEFSG